MVFSKNPGLYPDIGKQARDLLYRDYQGDQKLTLTTNTANGVAITSTGTKKGDHFLVDVNTQLKNKNITTDVKVDSNSSDSSVKVLCCNTTVIPRQSSFKVSC